ncbi:MAG: leucine-rich repeat domain-containing protein [Bacteroidota bacterium]
MAVQRFYVFLTLVLLSFSVAHGQKSWKIYALEQGQSDPQSVTYLDLSYMGLEELSSEIQNFKNLSTVDLSGNNFDHLPAALLALPSLEKLILDDNPSFKVILLIEQLKKLPTLQHLSIARCNLRILDAQIGDLENLVSLDLTGNNLFSLPETFQKLKGLQSLNLSDNALKSVEYLPKGIQQLDMSFNPGLLSSENMTRLSELPVLTNLSIRGAGSLSGLIGQLANLIKLDLGNGTFQVLPDEITYLKDLKTINLEGCSRLNLTRTFLQLSILKKLEELVISDHNRNRIPPGLSNIRRLKALTISGAKLESMPFDLHRCRKIESLKFTKTLSLDLESVIAQVGLMRKLKSLSFTNSAFTSLPTNLHLLDNIEQLDLTGNLLDRGLKELLATVLPACSIEFDQAGEAAQLSAIDIPILEMPWEKVEAHELKGEHRFTSGVKLRIDDNQSENSALETLKIQSFSDPLSAFLHGFFREDILLDQPSVKQMAACFSINWKSSPGNEETSLTLDWPSQHSHFHLDLFLKNDVAWEKVGRDELLLNGEQELEATESVSATSFEIPNIPDPPKAPLQEKIGVNIIEKRSNLVFSIEKTNALPSSHGEMPVKQFTELPLLENVRWRFTGGSPAQGMKVIESINIRKEGFATDFIIVPNKENKAFIIYFETPSGEFEIPVLPLFVGDELPVPDAASMDDVLGDFSNQYAESYFERTKEWTRIDDQYTRQLTIHQTAVEDFRKGMEGLASLVSPSVGSNLDHAGQFQRRVTLHAPGDYWIGRYRQVIGEEKVIVFTNSNGDPVYPLKTLIFDQTNDVFMVFPGSEIQIDTRSDNTILVLLEDGDIGLTTKGSMRNTTNQQNSKRLVIPLNVMEASAISKERLKYHLLGQ